MVDGGATLEEEVEKADSEGVPCREVISGSKVHCLRHIDTEIPMEAERCARSVGLADLEMSAGEPGLPPQRDLPMRHPRRGVQGVGNRVAPDIDGRLRR